jgi:hypothetical protein
MIGSPALHHAERDVYFVVITFRVMKGFTPAVADFSNGSS